MCSVFSEVLFSGDGSEFEISFQTDNFRFFVLFESQHFFVSGDDDISIARDLRRQAFTFNKALGAGSEMAPRLKVNFRKALVFWVTSSDVTKFLRCENRVAGLRF